MNEYQQNKRYTLMSWLAWFFIVGEIVYWVPSNSEFYPLFRTLITSGNVIFFLYWVMQDAREYKFRFSTVLLVMMILFGPLTLPYYLYKTRGKDWGRPMLWALLYLIPVIFVMSSGVMCGEIVSLLNGHPSRLNSLNDQTSHLTF